jgi:hypothetical protein
MLILLHVLDEFLSRHYCCLLPLLRRRCPRSLFLRGCLITIPILVLRSQRLFLLFFILLLILVCLKILIEISILLLHLILLLCLSTLLSRFDFHSRSISSRSRRSVRSVIIEDWIFWWNLDLSDVIGFLRRRRLRLLELLLSQGGQALGCILTTTICGLSASNRKHYINL